MFNVIFFTTLMSTVIYLGYICIRYAEAVTLEEIAKVGEDG